VRIALRPSGGRGEYELAGRQGEVSVDDLLEKDLVFELTPELSIDGHSSAQRVQGKPRIRLEPGGYSHAWAVLAAILLLPKPRRELALTDDGPDFLYDGGYAITDINVDVADIHNDSAGLRPTRLWLKSKIDFPRSVDVTPRLAQVQALWDAAKEQESKAAELVRDHEQAVVDGGHRAIQSAAAALRKELKTTRDLIGKLGAELGLETQEATITTATASVPSDAAQDDVDPAAAARRAVARWRKAVIRSAKGRAFSRKVRQIYSYRCAVSGDVFPKLPHTASAGVDGAHILPWARYELNSPRNGICLNKLCHWAFDAGVIRLDGDSQGRYFVSVPDRIRAEGLPMEMSLDYFDALEGEIPHERLPADEADWPSPLYLERLNSEVFS
jgi:hypothetical protein